MWLALAGLDNNLSAQALLDKIVNTLKAHPGLGVWKGADEPAHGHIPAAGLVAVTSTSRRSTPTTRSRSSRRRAGRRRRRGPDKPLTVAAVAPYAAACDIHGVDIYPISAARHARGRTTGQHRHQRRRRHDADPRPRDPPQGDLDDVADRLERRPAAASRSSSRRFSRRGSWPTTRSSPEPADCSSSAATSSRR